MVSEIIYADEENIKLYELFPKLKGIEMEIKKLGFCVRINNILKHGGIQRLSQLLAYSFDELIQADIGKNKDGFLNAIKYKLSKFNEFLTNLW